MRALSPTTVAKLLRNAYEKKAPSIFARDVNALAVSRLMQPQIPRLSSRELGAYCELVVDRLRSKRPGGRSLVLGTLASLLRPGLRVPLDRAFVRDLREAAERAVTEGTFLNPEFGMIIAASIFQSLGGRRNRNLLQHLTSIEPQNDAVGLLIPRFRLWLKRGAPTLEEVIDPEWLVERVVQYLPANADIFRRPNETEAVAARVSTLSLYVIAPEDLDLYLQVVRRDASSQIDRWMQEWGLRP
jgi:hypothetical protein